MALMITPTPVLEGEEAVEFLLRLAREQDDKVPLTPTPRLQEAREKILAHARSREE